MSEVGYGAESSTMLGRWGTRLVVEMDGLSYEVAKGKYHLGIFCKSVKPKARNRYFHSDMQITKVFFKKTCKILNRPISILLLSHLFPSAMFVDTSPSRSPLFVYTFASLSPVLQAPSLFAFMTLPFQSLHASRERYMKHRIAPSCNTNPPLDSIVRRVQPV